VEAGWLRPPASGGCTPPSSSSHRRTALRFRAYGERRFLTLGGAAEGWDRARAEVELQNVLADVRRGIWQPPRQEPAIVPERNNCSDFHTFSSEWYEGVAQPGSARASSCARRRNARALEAPGR